MRDMLGGICTYTGRPEARRSVLRNAIGLVRPEVQPPTESPGPCAFLGNRGIVACWAVRKTYLGTRISILCANFPLEFKAVRIEFKASTRIVSEIYLSLISNSKALYSSLRKGNRSSN